MYSEHKNAWSGHYTQQQQVFLGWNAPGDLFLSVSVIPEAFTLGHQELPLRHSLEKLFPPNFCFCLMVLCESLHNDPSSSCYCNM